MRGFHKKKKKKNRKNIKAVLKETNKTSTCSFLKGNFHGISYPFHTKKQMKFFSKLRQEILTLWMKRTGLLFDTSLMRECSQMLL